MNKQLIKNALYDSHESFINYLDSLQKEDFLVSKKDKWTAGQQLEHILLGVNPVRLALSLPKTILKLIWGTANRKSRSYDELVSKYISKLESGAKATGRFIPKTVDLEKGKRLMKKLKKEVNRLCFNMDRFSEEDLDFYVLPHPLLGKLTIREMLYFTIYHVNHHEKITKQGLT